VDLAQLSVAEVAVKLDTVIAPGWVGGEVSAADAVPVVAISPVTTTAIATTAWTARRSTLMQPPITVNYGRVPSPSMHLVVPDALAILTVWRRFDCIGRSIYAQLPALVRPIRATLTKWLSTARETDPLAAAQTTTRRPAHLEFEGDWSEIDAGSLASVRMPGSFSR